MIERIYKLLVNRVPGIQDRYKKKRLHAKGAGRLTVWIYLIYLNFSYYVFGNKKLEQIEKYPYYEEKLLYSQDSESSISGKVLPEEFANQMMEYDIISFDVFDTLILRPFSTPADLFYVLGNEAGYLDFQRIRMEMEWKAREKKYRQEKHYEVTLDDIYTLLAEETGLKKQETMEKELELEHRFCFANPYMREVTKYLKRSGKRLIVTSDMYLNTEQVKSLLTACGYAEFSAYYVSCDWKKSKNKGDLYEVVRQQEGTLRSFAHVGDNYIADIEKAKKSGFSPKHYVNVNAVGEPYRPYDMSVITGSIYRGIVNAHIHNGTHCYTREYEYGYIYGGLFVTGYCQFIHDYVQIHRNDKLLFLARDGDILMKAYEMLYPEEKQNCEYVYWSRLAATKMSAQNYKYDYFRRFLYHKVNQNYSIRQILSAMEAEDMLADLCKTLKLQETKELTDRNVDKVKAYLMSHWEELLTHYEEQLEAGKQYYSQILGGCKSAVAVDIGWAGSGAVTLDYIVNHIWKLDCHIVGIIAGTNTCHNAEPDTSETFLQSGKLVSYLYSQRENRDIWKLHDPGKDHNLYWEMLLDAPVGSLKGFYLDEKGNCKCRFKAVKADVRKVEAIQKGILEFVEEYRKVQKRLGGLGRISGRDAYAAMVNVESGVNEEFMKSCKEMMDDVNVV